MLDGARRTTVADSTNAATKNSSTLMRELSTAVATTAATTPTGRAPPDPTAVTPKSAANLHRNALRQQDWAENVQARTIAHPVAANAGLPRCAISATPPVFHVTPQRRKDGRPARLYFRTCWVDNAGMARQPGHTTARGWGHRHQRLRRELAPFVAAGQARCTRCGLPDRARRPLASRSRRRGPPSVSRRRSRVVQHVGGRDEGQHDASGPAADRRATGDPMGGAVPA